MKISLHRFKVLAAFASLAVTGASAQVVADSLSAANTVAYGKNDSQAAVMTICERLGQSESGVVVNAPEALLKRAEFQAENNAEAEQKPDEATEGHEEGRVVRTKSGKTVGYRVQIFADNNVRTAKAEARQRERAVGQAFPAYSTYVAYASPYWRLRVGDFRSQYDAEKAAAEIRKAFPRYAREVRVVRDHVNIR